MDSKELIGLQEAYMEVVENQQLDEATAMAKRGYDETKLRQRAGGGESADRATALEKKPTYGNDKAAKQRSEYARKQRGDFRNTASSSPGLHGYGHKSDDPKVKAKQAARGAQRGALTPNERKQLNMGDETFDIYDIILSHLLDEGYADTIEGAEVIMVNMSEEWREQMIDEALTGERAKKAFKKPGGMAYSRKVSEDPAKRATRGGKGGESDFGAGDRGSGNRAARRAGTYRED